MDELEISGRRYISTRRAGQENKYHADYIGQLIRGNKVAGQKIGRAWYVDAESLAVYLNNEPRSEEHSIHEPEPKIEQKDEILEEKKAPVPVEDRETYHIPIAKMKEEKDTIGLRYLQDDEPFLPVIEKNLSHISVMPRQEQREQPVTEAPVAPPRRRRKTPMLVPAISLLVLGVVTFLIVATLSTLTVSTSVVKNGQPASVGYSLMHTWSSL